jgi:hypothetical protein
MRKGRYKKNFLPPEQCPEFAQIFAPQIQNPLRLFERNELSAAEFAAEYLFLAFRLLKPQSWKGARLQKGEAGSALDHFRKFSFRGVPLSANRSLLSWHQGVYQLQLFFEVPDTLTVLQMQSRGIRCVTCLVGSQELGRYVMQERDPISFTLHDLIHADHFLANPLQRQVQVGFSRWMRELYSQEKLRLALAQNPQLASQFEYACADMNSNGAHLVKYLKAIFCIQNHQDLLWNISRSSQVSAAFLAALEALNTPAETSAHLQLLQGELFLKGASDPASAPDPGLRKSPRIFLA